MKGSENRTSQTLQKLRRRRVVKTIRGDACPPGFLEPATQAPSLLSESPSGGLSVARLIEHLNNSPSTVCVKSASELPQMHQAGSPTAQLVTCGSPVISQMEATEGQINTSHAGARVFIICCDLVVDCAGYTRCGCSLIQSEAYLTRRALSCRDNHSSTSTRTKDFTHSHKHRLSPQPLPHSSCMTAH